MQENKKYVMNQHANFMYVIKMTNGAVERDNKSWRQGQCNYLVLNHRGTPPREVLWAQIS